MPLHGVRFEKLILPALLILVIFLQPLPSQTSLRSSGNTGPSGSPHLGLELRPHASLPARLDALPTPVNSTFPSVNYDEQLGFTFTQNFSELSYNVTAVEQQDVYGFGPAYLLNGLSDLGYWYQVGLSWDWPLTTGGYSTGFGFNYEVFSPNGTSVFPLDAGGIANFSGPVDPGDTVDLSLSFSTSEVTMQAIDWRTNSIASITYQSFGADEFVGQTNGISNSRGYFTGLMTEEYHVAPYNGSETEVTYSSSNNISSAWMWVDEFNANTSSLIFLKSTLTPILYGTAPAKLQYFFFQGATLISNAFEFVTGTSGSVLLTVSYSEVGGVPPISPKFVYSSNGSIDSVQLGGDPTTYLVDNGSTWSVSNILPGLNSSYERWTTPDSTSGVAGADETINIVYYHQYLEYVSFEIVGGGSSYAAPDLTFINNGGPNSILLANNSLGIWVDAGTQWNATNPLPGSSSLERWVSNSTAGVFGSQGNVTIPYFHEDNVTVGYSLIGGGSGYSTPEIEVPTPSGTLRQTLSLDPASVWLDYGAQWRVSSILNSTANPAQRWITKSTTGTVNQSAIFPAYIRESLISLSYSVLGNGTEFSPLAVNLTSFEGDTTIALNNSRQIWADYGTLYSYPNVVTGATGERWIANSDSNGTILSQPDVSVQYQPQYYVSIIQPREGGGSILSLPSGWYNASEPVYLAFQSDPGWKLWSWSGSGTGSYSGNSTDPTLTVDSPLAETAVFYPALTMAAGKGGSVTFAFDGTTKTIASGQNVTIYVPPLSEVSLTASSPSALELFTNWHGAVSSASESLMVQVRYPETIEASFGFNYPLIVLSVVALISSTILLVLSIYRRRKAE